MVAPAVCDERNVCEFPSALFPSKNSSKKSSHETGDEKRFKPGKSHSNMNCSGMKESNSACALCGSQNGLGTDIETDVLATMSFGAEGVLCSLFELLMRPCLSRSARPCFSMLEFRT